MANHIVSGEIENTRNNGFTLLEISVVLIVTGLLIGSTLVGQEMIRTAEVRSVLRQIDTLETAVNSFRLKYGCLPGDCSNATGLGFQPTLLSSAASMPSEDGGFSILSNAYAGASKGDPVEADPCDLKANPKGCVADPIPDDPIPSTAGPNGNSDGKFLTSDDSKMMFNQLFQSGFIASSSANYVYLPTNAGGASGKTYWFVTYRDDGLPGNYWVPLSGTTSYNNATTSMAYGIDKKKDDGNPTMGNVAALNAAGVFVSAGDKSATACVSAGNAYNVALQTPNLCGLEIKTTF